MAVEKRRRTYDLTSIRAEFLTVDTLRMTAGSQTGAFALGLTRADVVTLIQGITSKHFYKSMTSFANHQVWQDVYHVPYEETVLYVKFTADLEGHIVISLKEK